MHSPDVSSALEHWTQLLGPQFVQSDPETLHAAGTATFATHQKIRAVLRPADRDQIIGCLRIATQFRIPLYPISTGKNWGYGSRVPPRDGCALLDVSRLDRILSFDEDLGYVTVEPGVTQRQIIHTGAARFEGSKIGEISRWGVGPSLDGLFSQSNFGIVTRMTIWLMPKPEAFEAFFFRCESASGLAPLIDSLRRLRMHDVLRSSVHIANDYKVLGGIQQYPWEEMKGRTPISPADMAVFRKKLSFGYWNASGALYGTQDQISEAKRLLARELREQAGELKFLSPQKLRLAKRFAAAFHLITRWDLRRTIALVEPVLGLMQGKPMSASQALRSAYWRKRTPLPADPDPDRDRCGLLWYAPVAPAKGEEVLQLVNLASDILLRSGFEPMISLTLLTPRTVYAVLSLTYDREVPGEDEKAMTCYEQLHEACTHAGYFPYRLGIHSMTALPEPAAYQQLMRKLKQAFDPEMILAPGRYDSGITE